MQRLGQQKGGAAQALRHDIEDGGVRLPGGEGPLVLSKVTLSN